MIKKKISEDVQEIYVEKYPDRIRKRVYRGDLFTHTLIGFNFDDTPFDFSVYDSFKASIRINEDYSDCPPEYNFKSSEIILGRINGQGSVFDELKIQSKNAINFPIVGKSQTAYFDIQGSQDGKTLTFMKIKLRIEVDITREFDQSDCEPTIECIATDSNNLDLIIQE